MNESPSILILNTAISQPSTSTVKCIETPESTHDNLDSVQDFSKVCRTCASATEFVIPIFTGDGLQINLAEKINKHLPISVLETDVLPLSVCYQCANTLVAWHELVTCCRRADTALHERLAQLTYKESNTRISKLSPTLEEDDAQSKFRCDTENFAVSEKIKSVDSIAAPDRCDAAPAPSATLPIGPVAISLQSMTAPERTLPPRLHVTAPPLRFITPRVPFAAVPADGVAPRSRSSVSRLREPPEYAPPHRRCDFCDTLHPEDEYLEHIRTDHSENVFYCDECKMFINKTVLVLHMSLHAYGYIQKKDLNSKENRNSVDSESKRTAETEDVSSKTIPNVETCSKVGKNNEENDFSDHSDTENGFDPIPESVFDAIEDTQDSQPGDIGFTPETEQVSDESLTPTPLTEEEKSKKSNQKCKTCPVCSRKFTASSSFFYHIKFTHKRIKEHKCDVCSSKFATKASLAAHMTTHTDERKYACRECNKRFRSRASLYIHEQIHIGIKTYSCTQCHRSFRWKTHLTRHMTRHAAEKVHLCTTCGRGFSVRCDLLRHMRTHAAGQFPCAQCSLVFAQLRYLKVHVNKKHAVECDTNG